MMYHLCGLGLSPKGVVLHLNILLIIYLSTPPVTKELFLILIVRDAHAARLKNI